MAEKPTAAFVLSIISGILILINGAIVIVAGGLAEEILPGMGAIISAVGFVGLIFGILVLIGAVLMYSIDPGKVKIGAILVLIFSILSIFTGGGFFIGFILGLIGGILGLVWKPPAKPTPTIPSPTIPPT